MRPEMPFLAAGGVAIAGATVRDKKLPPLSRALIGLLVLVIVASMTSNTRLAPLVSAFGMLVLLVTVIATTNIVFLKTRKVSNG